jgi:Xaa-Pro aminopeptidase
MHKTGHWLGLDVAADDATVDAKGRGIGIRIEDDVAITQDGHRVLTDGLARSADEIEAFMQDGR